MRAALGRRCSLERDGLLERRVALEPAVDEATAPGEVAEMAAPGCRSACKVQLLLGTVREHSRLNAIAGCTHMVQNYFTTSSQVVHN